MQIPSLFSDFWWKGYDLHLASGLSPGNDSKNNMEVLASGLTIAGTSIQAVKAALKLQRDFRDAEKQILQAESERQQIHLNSELLDQLPPSVKERIGPAEVLLHDVETALPLISHSTKKKDRLKWVVGRKAEFERAISPKCRIESSAQLSLLLSHSQNL